MGERLIETLRAKLEDEVRRLLPLVPVLVGTKPGDLTAAFEALGATKGVIEELDAYYDRADRGKRAHALWQRIYRELVARMELAKVEDAEPGSCPATWGCSRRAGWRFVSVADGAVKAGCKQHLSKLVERAATTHRANVTTQAREELGIEAGQHDYGTPKLEVVELVASKLGIEAPA